jgi:hypothetical protein
MNKIDELNIGMILPSQFMRDLRPEYYSDTEDRVEYLLDSSILEYHLDSITSHNQTNDFEIFCRKLCERTICPNLRAHTGPDGGGDSKADAETYPVAKEISDLFYIGEENSAHERWAFAFSAKKTWTTKVRDDVKGIVETERDYKKIIFVTSRFARDKTRSNIEDELTSKYGIPVTIHDRTWIVKEIIENDRKDIAFNYLGIGEAKTDPLRLGPTDYSRAKQLAEIEKSIDDLEIFKGMEQQRVTEALLAAKLSRNIELPRLETDGRFLRAIRLADADGTYRQKLEANYEYIWTAFWWFDDFQFLKDSYEPFEELALKSDHALNLEFLCNLLQLLVNSVIHNHISRGECKLDERASNLKEALEKVADNKDSPNNALEAQTSLLIMRMNKIILDGKHEELTKVWSDFSNILEKANGLGEFKADRLVKMVEVAGNIAGNNQVYNALVEKTAEFVGNRKNEAEGALILLKRAQQLDFEDNFEIIRLLGKAVIGLSKNEYSEHLIEALQLLMLAYRSAGLLWAARASCTFLAASLVIEGEEESQLPVSFAPTMKIWAWIALELCYIPDFLFAIQLLNGSLTALPLSEESKAKVEKDICELDLALGSLFLNLGETSLRKLSSLPDVLESLGLFMSRSALLYTLGHVDTLRDDGSLPESESDEDVNQIFTMLASQPVAKNLRDLLILNLETPQIFRTTILGMTVDINVGGSLHSILVAEAVLGSLEAFFATAIEQRVMPHTEKLYINLVESDEISEPSFEIKVMDMKGTLIWPYSLSLTSFDKQKEVHEFITEISGKVLASTCMVDDVNSFLQKLYEDEAVHHRISMVAFSGNSYSRVATKSVSRISDWQELTKNSYELLDKRPEITIIDLNAEDEKATLTGKGGSSNPPEINDHRALNVRSIIDIYAWNQAGWRGTAYAQVSPAYPPCVAFLFENEEGARKIFERWRERFGTQDKNEEISLSIIRQLPKRSKHHYCILITSKLPEAGDCNPDQILSMATRSMVMEPNDDINLDTFLKSYNNFGKFNLMPAVLNENGEPELLFDLSILKNKLNVKLAENINAHDVEAIALRVHEI